MSKRNKIIFIIVLGFLVYSNSFSVPFIWDDFGLIINNPLIKQIRLLPQLFINRLMVTEAENKFFRPIQAVSNMLDFRIWNENPFGFHLTNILLHSLCAILLYYLFTIIFAREHIAFLSALVFLIHPVNVEAVTYISGRADSLALVFLLACFINYVRFRLYAKRRLFCYSCILFVLALLCKELALAGVFLFVLLDYAVDRKINFKYYSIFLGLALGYLLLRYLVFGSLFIKSEHSLSTRFLTSLLHLFDYLRILLFPVNLHMSYVPRIVTSFSPGLLLRLFSCVFLFFIFSFVLRKEKKVFLFCLCWFFIFLIPQSGIFPINVFFAEHFIYLSEYALFFLFIWTCSEVLKTRKILHYAILATMFASLAVITFSYTQDWIEPVKFYRRIISFTPGNYIAHHNLGVELNEQGRTHEAEEQYMTALRINQDFAPAYNSLGILYLDSGKLDKAIVFFKQAIARGQNNAAVYYYLGRALRLAGDFSAANEAFKTAKKIVPWDSSVYIELALLYRDQARIEEAIEVLKNAIRLEPENSSLHLDLGLFYKETGEISEAITEYALALKLDTDSVQAYNNLGVLYAEMGDLKKASYCLYKATQLDADFHEARFNLGLLYFQMDENIKAREELLKIPEASPIFPLAKEQIEKFKYR
ncbi:MAG: tetratricopeptide repeat protein [Candidatus Omnitrophota bacterium]